MRFVRKLVKGDSAHQEALLVSPSIQEAQAVVASSGVIDWFQLEIESENYQFDPKKILFFSPIYTDTKIVINTIETLKFIRKAKISGRFAEKIPNTEVETAQDKPQIPMDKINADWKAIMQSFIGNGQDQKNLVQEDTLIARMLLLKAIEESVKLEAKAEIIQQVKITSSRILQSFGHLVVEGFLKNLAVVAFASFIVTELIANAQSDTRYPTREPFAALGLPVLISSYLFASFLARWTLFNQYNYAARTTVTPISNAETDRLQWDWRAIYNKLKLNIWEQEKVLDYSEDSRKNNLCLARALVTTIVFVEMSDGACAGLALLFHAVVKMISNPIGAFGFSTALGLFFGFIKAIPAVRVDAAIGWERRCIERYKTQDEIIPPLGNLVSFAGWKEETVVKILRICLPLLYMSFHIAPLIESPFLNRLLTWSNGYKEDTDAAFEQHKLLVYAVKFSLVLLVAAGASAKTVLFDLKRIGHKSFGDSIIQGNLYGESCSGKITNNIAAFLGCSGIIQHFDKTLVRYIMTFSFFIGIQSLMKRALDTAVDSLFMPYVKNSTGNFLTQPLGPTNPIEILMLVFSFWASWSQSRQAANAFREHGEKLTAKSGKEIDEFLEQDADGEASYEYSPLLP